MNRNDLYESISHADEDALAKSERKQAKVRRRPWWSAAVAAVLVLAVAAGVILYPGNVPIAAPAYAVASAEYPQAVPFPSRGSENFDAEYEAWQASRELQQREAGYADGLEPFFVSGMQEFLSGADGQNRVYSPVNVYMALTLLAETTGGESRQQILDLLGSDSIESMRAQANDVWNTQYRDDGTVTSILGNSLWLNQEIRFKQETMDLLAKEYYASSFSGKMGSEEMNTMLQNWLNEQTAGLLEEQAKQMQLDPNTVLALASSICFQAKWSATFNETNTKPDVFHTQGGDVTVDFMNSREPGNYYRGKNFGAVGRTLDSRAGTMWFLLPDEGVTVEELLADPEAMEFILANGKWSEDKHADIQFSMPKFDVTSQMDLRTGLENLGVTDVFDAAKADFSPMAEDADGICMSAAQHDARVAVDEEGIIAAAYTVMTMTRGMMPPAETVEFKLDRPFVFAITSGDGLPLFSGVVNQPA